MDGLSQIWVCDRGSTTCDIGGEIVLPMQIAERLQGLKLG